MIWFPQMSSGAVAQYPMGRSRAWRMIANDLENGERIALADPNAGGIGWQLSCHDLSDAEAGALSTLFTSVNGGAGAFGFVDPIANLLAWSEDLSRPDWQTGTLQKAPGQTDPSGTQRAWSLTNNAGAPQSLQQTLGFPGGYVACFSVWVKSSAKESLILQRDSVTAPVAVGTSWRRVSLTATGVQGSDESTFSIVLAAGQGIQIFGPQVEAQPNPSAYKSTVAARGIYQETRFGSDELNIVATGVGRSACQVSLLSRV